MLADLLAKLERAKAAVKQVKAVAAELPPDLRREFVAELAAALDLPEAAAGKDDAPPLTRRGRPEGATADRREAIVRLLATEGQLTRTAIARRLAVRPSLANRAILNPPGPDWFRTAATGRTGALLELTPAGWDEFHRLGGGPTPTSGSATPAPAA